MKNSNKTYITGCFRAKKHTASIHIMDLDKLNLVNHGYCGLILGSSQFCYCASCLKKYHFKSGQKRLKNNHLTLLASICDTLCRKIY